ncbi:MAG: hypothetical protein A4E69_00365 [Syntrophus sp. PtaB.Bin138]|nr:MAG: hypothetical protein A4E69_00365 [Syntrophus sp. PtaB.Bin138]
MMRRKRSLLTVCFIAMAILLLPGTAAMAYQVQLSDGVGTDGGGMFGVWNASVVPHTFLFNTFCLERNEYINFSKHYDFTIDTWAIQGGVGGGSPDPLDPDTAFLYYKFRTNPLSLGMDVTKSFDVTAFQYAIWYLEDELTPDAETSIPLFYRAKAKSYLDLAYADNSQDIGVVRVLNLTYKDATGKIIDAQSMLTLVPEPSILILLGLGMFGVGIASRKMKK